jgi:hypothetical protein
LAKRVTPSFMTGPASFAAPEQTVARRRINGITQVQFARASFERSFRA